MPSNHKPTHQTITVDGLEIFYRSVGDPARPALLLLHGVPTSSYMFRHLLAPLAETMFVVAPDLPGQGFSAAPPRDQYDYTFETISRTIERFLEAMGIDRFYLYMNDFGTPVGYHLATRHPDRIRGLIIQNGNAHDAGLGPAWEAPKAFWANPTPENKAKIPEWLNFDGTRATYIGGLPERLQVLHPPEGWFLDWERMSRPGNTEIHFALFHDYRNHVARFPAIAAYHREHQPPGLLLWGRHDPYFAIDEIMAYSQALDVLEMHVFESGHFLLETHHQECAALITAFVQQVETGHFAAPTP